MGQGSVGQYWPGLHVIKLISKGNLSIDRTRCFRISVHGSFVNASSVHMLSCAATLPNVAHVQYRPHDSLAARQLALANCGPKNDDPTCALSNNLSGLKAKFVPPPDKESANIPDLFLPRYPLHQEPILFEHNPPSNRLYRASSGRSDCVVLIFQSTREFDAII